MTARGVHVVDVGGANAGLTEGNLDRSGDAAPGPAADGVGAGGDTTTTERAA